MTEHSIAVIGGDGIGPEVTTQAMKVIDTCADIFGFKLRRVDYPFGSQHYLDTGDIFPDDAFEEVKGMDAIYLGAIGDPRLPVGQIEFGIIAKMRFELDLYLNMRPIQLFHEALCPIKGKTPADVDMVIIRENTEGAYAGMHGFAHKGQALEVATQTMVYTRAGVERAIRAAFELAVKRDKRKQVTLIDKANAVRAHDIWTRVFDEVSREFPEVTTDHAYIDAACMWMIKNPEWFDVAVTPNLMGDIITDLGAMVQGGMGMAASANVNPGHVSLFEPIHGSAPKHAGKNIASPVAAILAGGMMLEFLGQPKAREVLETAIKELFATGRLRGVGTGVHPTEEVGDMIIEALKATAASV